MSPSTQRAFAPALAAAVAAAFAAAALLVLLHAPAAAASGVATSFQAPLEPPGTGGLELVDRALAKLSGHRRVLVVGAHPDDEDTTLLALVARGMGGEAAYLSLSRGEGGQNLIGPELGPGLGLIRSQELMAARRVDGARQYFTRAYDFGYTRSLDETFARWPREVLLEDAVRVVRRFRPQVVVAVFPPDERAGHGQHQASGVVAAEAYALAGEAQAFPGLAAEGLAPWRPQAFYRAAWWAPEAATVVEPAAPIDPVSGRSVFQVAMASRSRHRSQDMGMLEPLGPQDSRLAWEAGGAGAAGDRLFAGVDTRLAALAATLPAGEARSEVEALLARVEELAAAARQALSPARLGDARPRLVEIVAALREARRRVEEASPGAPSPAVHAAALIDEKLAVAELALAAAAGVAVDAVADREAVAPGGAWTIDTAAWASGGAGGGVEFGGVEPAGTGGLAFEVEPLALEAATGFAAFFMPNADPERGFHRQRFRVAVPAAAAPTVPYFLARPLAGDLYDWSAAPAAVRGEPFGPPPLVARFAVEIDGVELTLEREVVHRWRDQARGEVRRPLRVVPPLEVAVAPDLVVRRTATDELPELRLTLVSHVDRPLLGSPEIDGRGYSAALHAVLPNGRSEWPLPGYTLFAHGKKSGVAELSYRTQEGERYDLAVPLVDYPHIRPTPYPVPATVEVETVDLALPDLGRVGYVRGAADRVPEALAAVGVPVEVLEPAALAGADLAAFDTVVVGPRAYETEPALAAANERLLDYARGGGLLVVQYQQYAFVDGGFAPYPLSIARPHGRVTDETAPVTPLVADHPLFNHPNALGAADWERWVQERGLYFAATWDERYTPLLAMRDPDQAEALTGGLLVAPLGEGTYVYTGLAFFRQLPAGVPGAYRLFANLLALGGAPEAR